MHIEEIEKIIPLNIGNAFHKYQGNKVTLKSMYMISENFMGLGSYLHQIWFFNSVKELKEFIPALIFIDMIIDEESFDWEADYSTEYEKYKGYLMTDSLEDLLESCYGCWGKGDFCIEQCGSIKKLYQDISSTKIKIMALNRKESFVEDLFDNLENIDLSIYSKQIIYQYLTSLESTKDSTIENFLEYLKTFEFYAIEFS